MCEHQGKSTSKGSDNLDERSNLHYNDPKHETPHHAAGPRGRLLVAGGAGPARPAVRGGHGHHRDRPAPPAN